MLRLITALEAASEGNEYLDIQIQKLDGLVKPIPPYTRSLDAALRLVPETWSVHRLRHQTDGRGEFTSWMVELYRASDAMIEVASAATAASAPLAICAAALRVRQIESSAETRLHHQARVAQHVRERRRADARLA